MLKRKSLIMMLLFSFLAHLAIAGSLIYVPLRFSGNNRVIRAGKVIWGIVQNQGARENSRRDRPSGLSIERVAGKKRKTEVGGKKSEVRSEILMSLQGTKEHENPPPLMGGGEGEGEQRVLAPLPLVPSHEGRGNKEREFSDESIEMGRQEREIDGRSDPEDLFSHQETFQTGMDGGCNESKHCTGIWVSDNLTSGADKIIARSGESGRDHLRGILEGVRREIERHKYYPSFARRNGIEGTVYMNFHIGSDGRPGSISIGRSSGFKILDDSATKTLKNIRQFSTIPEEMRGLDITVPIAYKLTEENRK